MYTKQGNVSAVVLVGAGDRVGAIGDGDGLGENVVVAVKSSHSK